MIERLIFLRTHKEEAKRIKSKKSFIMHAIYILLDLLWNFLEVRTQFDCPSQSNPAILYGTIFFFFLENCHLAASPHHGHEVFKQYSNITIFLFFQRIVIWWHHHIVVPANKIPMSRSIQVVFEYNNFAKTKHAIYCH